MGSTSVPLVESHIHLWPRSNFVFLKPSIPGAQHDWVREQCVDKNSTWFHLRLLRNLGTVPQNGLIVQCSIQSCFIQHPSKCCPKKLFDKPCFKILPPMNRYILFGVLRHQDCDVAHFSTEFFVPSPCTANRTGLSSYLLCSSLATFLI